MQRRTGECEVGVWKLNEQERERVCDDKKG